MSLPGFSLALPGQVLFGRGRASEAAGLILEHGRSVLMVRGRSMAFAGTLAAELRSAGAQVSEETGQGEPTLPQIETALAALRGQRIDLVVAVGGGSVIDLGKALAALIPQPGAVLDHLEGVGAGRPLNAAPLPFVALPTTAGTGAEATKNAVIGVPEAGRKVSLRDLRMLPDLAIVDPALTDHCPAPVTLASGLDAVTQVIEPYLSARANPVTDALCRDAIPRGLIALRRLMEREDAAARDALCLTSVTGGIALANAGLGAVHGLAGVIGGATGMAHGVICGRLLVPCLRANATALEAAGADMARMDEVRGWIAAAFGATPQDAFATFQAWINAQGLPFLPEDRGADADWARTAQGASSMKGNPVVLGEAALLDILAAARRPGGVAG